MISDLEFIKEVRERLDRLYIAGSVMHRGEDGVIYGCILGQMSAVRRATEGSGWDQEDRVRHLLSQRGLELYPDIVGWHDPYNDDDVAADDAAGVLAGINNRSKDEIMAVIDAQIEAMS